MDRKESILMAANVLRNVGGGGGCVQSLLSLDSNKHSTAFGAGETASNGYGNGLEASVDEKQKNMMSNNTDGLSGVIASGPPQIRSNFRTMNTGRWSADEHQRFLTGLDRFGSGSWKKITELVGTRSCTQIRTHAQKYFIALQKPGNTESVNGIDDTTASGTKKKKSKMITGAVPTLQKAAAAGGDNNGRRRGLNGEKIGADGSQTKHSSASTGVTLGNSAIVERYGKGDPINLAGIIPVTAGIPVGSTENAKGGSRRFPPQQQQHPLAKQQWNPYVSSAVLGSGDMTGIDALTRAAATGGGGGGNSILPHHVTHKSSLDKAVEELRLKIANEADAIVHSTSSSVAPRPPLTASSGNEGKETAAKRKREGQQRRQRSASNSSVISSDASISDRHQKASKLIKVDHNEYNNTAEVVRSVAGSTSAPTAGVESSTAAPSSTDFVVLDRMQAAAERQELFRLRQEVKALKDTIIQLNRKSMESEGKITELITDRRLALNECKNLHDLNGQLKTEIGRMVLLFEQVNKEAAAKNFGGINGEDQQKQQTIDKLIAAAATKSTELELLQGKLKESDARYHTVTESLSRQTGVLTDQHRAILELNNQLNSERKRREEAEGELQRLRTEMNEKDKDDAHSESNHNNSSDDIKNTEEDGDEKIIKKEDSLTI